MNSVSEGHLAPQKVARIIAEKVPFNRELGFEIEFEPDGRPILHFEMKPELVGNFVRGNLHGGVISSALDVIGGLSAFCALLQRADLKKENPEDMFAKLGTIDLRIDYLRAGFGKVFRAEGFVLRVGRRVGVTRMELHSDNGDLVAAGTGAYIVG